MTQVRIVAAWRRDEHGVTVMDTERMGGVEDIDDDLARIMIGEGTAVAVEADATAAKPEPTGRRNKPTPAPDTASSAEPTE